MRKAGEVAASQLGDLARCSSSSRRPRPAALQDVTALGFPLCRQVTMSREQDVSVGLWGLGFFAGDAAAVGTQRCTALEAEIKHGITKTA